MFRFAAILLAASLCACGMKGSLVLPPGPAPEPLLGSKSEPVKPQRAKSPGEHGSTDQNTAPQ